MEDIFRPFFTKRCNFRAPWTKSRKSQNSVTFVSNQLLESCCVFELPLSRTWCLRPAHVQTTEMLGKSFAEQPCGQFGERAEELTGGKACKHHVTMGRRDKRERSCLKKTRD